MNPVAGPNLKHARSTYRTSVIPQLGKDRSRGVAEHRQRRFRIAQIAKPALQLIVDVLVSDWQT
jgi:hypothetical protein